MSSRSRRTVAKTSSQTPPTPNHLQPIRAIRVESGEPRRSLTQVFQIFFQRRLSAFQPPPRSRFGAAGSSRDGAKQRRAENVDVAKALMESMFCAFIKFWAALRAQCRGKTSATSRRASRAHNR
jgi:hypothetical protein